MDVKSCLKLLAISAFTVFLVACGGSGGGSGSSIAEGNLAQSSNSVSLSKPNNTNISSTSSGFSNSSLNNSSVALPGNITVTVTQSGDGGYVYTGVITTAFNTGISFVIAPDEGFTPVISGTCPAGFYNKNSDGLIAGYQINFSNFFSDCSVEVAFKFTGVGGVSSSSSSVAQGNNGLKINLTANFQQNGDLLLNWNMTSDASLNDLKCEFYLGIYKQQLRVPNLTINQCPMVGNNTISLPAFTSGDIYMRVSDGKNINSVQAAMPSPLNLDPVISAIDWGQTVVTSNPKLVPDREALFRVHVTSSKPLPVPDLQVTLNLNGKMLDLIPQVPAELASEKNYLSFRNSYTVIIPKKWMQEGLIITAKLPNQQPRMIKPVFAARRVLNLTVVPLEIVGISPVTIHQQELENLIAHFWPFSDVRVKMHSTIKTSAGVSGPIKVSDIAEWLNEVREIRAIEGGLSHYLGIFANDLSVKYGSDFGFAAGMADVGGVAAIAYDWQQNIGYLTASNSTILHELGHNFGLGHVNCGGNPEGIDSAFPYDARNMGSVGISADLKKLYIPRENQYEGFADIMSYCDRRHVSDYSYNKVQDFIQSDTSSFNSPNLSNNNLQKLKSSERSIYITGQLSNMNTVSLRQIIPLDRAEKNQPNSDYILRVKSVDGEDITRKLQVYNVADAEPSSQIFFSVQIPFVEIASLEIIYNGKIIFNKFTDLAVKSQKLSAANETPIVSENGKEVCADWSPSRYQSVILIHRNLAERRVMFMDNDSGHFCVPTDDVAEGGDWLLLLRSGLNVSELVFPR